MYTRSFSIQGSCLIDRVVTKINMSIPFYGNVMGIGNCCECNPNLNRSHHTRANLVVVDNMHYI